MPTWNRFAPVSAVPYRGALYVANGVNQPQVWDGVEGGNAYNMGAVAPNIAPSIATDGGAGGSLTAGAHRYYYTFYRAATDNMPAYESGPSAVSNDYTVVGTEGIDVTYSDPVSDGYDNVRIYRQGGSLNEIYLVNTVALGGSPYNDLVADTTIVGNAILNFDARVFADGLTPKFAFLTQQDGRIVGGAPSGDTTKVYISEVFPRHEHFPTLNFLDLPDTVTALASTYEAVYGFTLHSIYRLVGIDDPSSMELTLIHGDVGAGGPAVARGNTVYCMDPGEGPMRINLDGSVDKLFGAKMRDFWRDNVNKDMLPFLPIESDDEENYIKFFVATGTRPYATHVMVFDEVTNQWTIWHVHGVTASGRIQNQYGKRKVAFGTIAGDIFQFGERSDQSLGAYTGTLTGNPSSIGGNQITGSGFDTSEPPGSTILLQDSSGDITYRGVVVAATSTVLTVFPNVPSTASTGDTFLLGGIEAYWQTKEEAFDAPQVKKIVKWVRVSYEIQTAGSLTVDYKVDGGSWTNIGTIDMTGDGAGQLSLNKRGHYFQFRVRNNQPGRPFHLTDLEASGVILERTR